MTCVLYQSSLPAVLAAGEKVDMPVFFYIDPEFATDPRLRGIDHLTLSYTFFKVCAGRLLKTSVCKM